MGFIWKYFLSPFPPFLPRFHPFMGASFCTIQHWAFIIPLKWSTFHSPTYVCSFKITIAVVWMEGMIHLLLHSVTVGRNQKHQGLAVFEKYEKYCFWSIVEWKWQEKVQEKPRWKIFLWLEKSDSPLLLFLSVYLVLAKMSPCMADNNNIV